MNKEDNKRALRLQVHQILRKLTEGTTVTIPKGQLASQYAHTYARHMGLRYNVIDGKVYLAGDIRKKVHQALKKLTKCNPVTIPKGQLASQYAYAHARERGLRYNVIDGKVYLAENSTLRAQVLQAMALLTEDNTVRIPVGRQAASYAYAYAASVLRTCSVRKGIVTFVRKDNPQLRVRVFAALDAIAPENPVKIPKGVLAVQYAYEHAREHGRHYKITSGGIVSILAGKELK